MRCMALACLVCCLCGCAPSHRVVAHGLGEGLLAAGRRVAQAAGGAPNQRGDPCAHHAVRQGHAFGGADRGGDKAHRTNPFGHGRKPLTRCW